MFETLCIIFPDNIWYACDSKDPSCNKSSLDFRKVDFMVHLSSVFSIIYMFHNIYWAPTVCQDPTHLLFPLDSMFQSHKGSSPSMRFSLCLADLIHIIPQSRRPFLYSSPSQLPTVTVDSMETSPSLESFTWGDRTCSCHGEGGCHTRQQGALVSIIYSFPRPWS